VAGLFLGVFLDFFLPFLLALEFLARLDRYFATRSLVGDGPIELNTDKVWLGSVTRQNLSVPRAQCCRTVEVGSPPVLACTV
jgi:hypothetical protein